MSNYLRNLTGDNLRKQPLRTFKIEDEMWRMFCDYAEELSNEGGLKITASELLRRVIKKTLREAGKL